MSRSIYQIVGIEKYAFFDRDGTLIFEPQDTYQVDSLDKLKILEGVVDTLAGLVKRGYKLVLISNQDGLGTESFPTADFEAPQQKMLNVFKEAGVSFERILICPHFEQYQCACRKPKTGLVDDFIKKIDIDKAASFVCGDRDSDRQFARNINLRFIGTETNGKLSMRFAVSYDE